MNIGEDFSYEYLEVIEFPELAHEIDPVAAHLAQEYWVDPEYATLEASGIDVGRMIFYSQAVVHYCRKLNADKNVKEAIAKYRQDPKPTPIVELPLETLERALPGNHPEEVLIALPLKISNSAKGISGVHGITFGQSLRVAAQTYLEDQHNR